MLCNTDFSEDKDCRKILLQEEERQMLTNLMKTAPTSLHTSTIPTPIFYDKSLEHENLIASAKIQKNRRSERISEMDLS